MASIRTTVQKNGSISYKINIRKKNHQIIKSFMTEEDAKLYIFHKERLINLMENFEVPIEKRITLQSMFEMKIRSLRDAGVNSHVDVENASKRILPFFSKSIFYDQITYEDWLECAKKLLDEDVYRGAKKEWTKRKMSPSTLRNTFACVSSAVSFVQSKGINVENIPLKVMQTYITPKIKLLKSKD